MSAYRRLAALAVLSAATACGNAPAPAGGEPGAAPCLRSDCGELIRLVPIPDAENLRFLPDGRLIVSGGQNVYEISGSLAEGYSARPLSSENCNFTGLAVNGGRLYANCADGRLFSAPLSGDLALAPTGAIAGACLLNGLATGPDGALYAVDSPLAPDCTAQDPRILRLLVDDAGAIVAQQDWLVGSPAGGLAFGTDNVLRFPNGLAVDGDRFYGTDGGSVYRVVRQADGSAGELQPLHFAGSVLDDLSLVPSGLLVADFGGGRILRLDADGRLVEAGEALFESPSAVRLGQGPLFEPGDVLVTEKGVIGDTDGPAGNVLSLLRRRAGAN